MLFVIKCKCHTILFARPVVLAGLDATVSCSWYAAVPLFKVAVAVPEAILSTNNEGFIGVTRTAWRAMLVNMLNGVQGGLKSEN